MEKYEVLGDECIGYGSFEEVWCVENKLTKERFAMKWFERGPKIDENVVREITIHKSLCHPNVIQFKEVVLTPFCLGIVMEYAKGGDLHDKIFKNSSRIDEFPKRKKRLGQNMARYYFRQLMLGVLYCHSKGLWMGIMMALFVKALSLGKITLCTNWEKEVNKASERVHNSVLEMHYHKASSKANRD